MIEQGSLVALTTSEVNAVGMRADDSILHACSMTFDPSVYLVWSPLLCGARLVLGRKDAYVDPEYLRWLLVEHEISFTEWVPSVLALYMKSVSDAFPSCFR